MYRGDFVDKQNSALHTAAMRDFELELMLLINERLYQKRYITTEMYLKAKELILKI